jgi:hypothetical protein
MIQVYFGHQRWVSLTTAEAAAKLATVCPEGKERNWSPSLPRMKFQLVGSSTSTSGRARPKTCFRTPVLSDATRIDSVPCRPRSAMRSLPKIRPTAYMLVPM